MKKRAFLIVLDSVGIGEMPDAADWGDAGSNTLQAIRNHSDFDCPNLTKMGLFSIDGIVEKIDSTRTCYGGIGFQLLADGYISTEKENGKRI